MYKKLACAILFFVGGVTCSTTTFDNRQMQQAGAYMDPRDPPIYSNQQPPPQTQQLGGGGPGVPPFGFKDPGFSYQHGFEGFLVPNSFFGLAPFGIEGIIIVIIGVIVFSVLAAAILALIAWFCGLLDVHILKESARDIFPSNVSAELISDITTTVLEALDKYNDVTGRRYLH